MSITYADIVLNHTSNWANCFMKQPWYCQFRSLQRVNAYWQVNN